MLWNMQSDESEITTDGPPLFLERYREAHKKLPDGQTFFDEYKILNISPQHKNIWTYKNIILLSLFSVLSTGYMKIAKISYCDIATYKIASYKISYDF